MSEDNENETDPYEGYPTEDLEGIRAQGAANVLDTLQRVLGEREMANLQERIANADPLTFKDEKEWTADDWGNAYASGKKDFAQLPEKVQRRIEG